MGIELTIRVTGLNGRYTALGTGTTGRYSWPFRGEGTTPIEAAKRFIEAIENKKRRHTRGREPHSNKVRCAMIYG